MCRACVVYEGEGYGAGMAWIQVIRYGTGNEGETVSADVAPQLAGAGVPYYSWGPKPSFFDAPSVPIRGITWTADTFLTASPDALMKRVVEPACGSAGATRPSPRIPRSCPSRAPPVKRGSRHAGS